MLQKFIWWTGLSDFLVGAGTWAGAVAIAMAAEPVTGQFVPLITLGTFLLMAAALLMWSSHDMANRAPVFFWQGLVRLSAIYSLNLRIELKPISCSDYISIPKVD